MTSEDMPAQCEIVNLAERLREIEELKAANARMWEGYLELDEITNSNDVMMMKRKVLRRHLREILQKAAIREGGKDG